MNESLKLNTDSKETNPTLYMRKWRARNPDYYKKRAATLEGKLKARQQRKNHLSVDHDHSTGAVRGILCNACNRALGTFGDTVEGLERALGYLKP